jgi:thioesterase domain-containing protein
MTPNELEHYLHDHIPLSKAMAASVQTIEAWLVILRAPLAPNINHRETVFGGSASALAILAAWSLLHTRMRRDGIGGRLVIQRNSMEYELPIAGEFTARASLAQPEAWGQFIRTLARRGKARVTVVAVLDHDGHAVGRFSGDFVALGDSAT